MAFLKLVRVEWVKTMRMRTSYIAFVAIAILTFAVQLGMFYRKDSNPFAQNLKDFDIDVGWFVNGYLATLITMFAAFLLVMVPMTIVTFARQVAGEDLRGTLRLILSRPISRLSLINAKFVVCLGYALLLMGFFFMLSYGLGIVLFGFHPSLAIANNSEEFRFSELSPDYQSMNAESLGRRPNRRERWQDRPEFDWRASPQGRDIRDQIEARLKESVISRAECIRKLVYAWLLSSWSLMTLGSLAFLYSTVNKHPIAAMALTIGTYFGVMAIQGLASQQSLFPLFEKIEPYLFTTVMDDWLECFYKTINWSNMWKSTWILGAYSVGFFALAQFIFWRKDITS